MAAPRSLPGMGKDEIATPQHYEIVKVEQSGDVEGVYGGQRVILAPIGGSGQPVAQGQILATEDRR